MYKRAGRVFNSGYGVVRRTKDEETEQEEKEFGRVAPVGKEPAQAGIYPPASLEFKENVTNALRELVDAGCRDCVTIAINLNNWGILNNLGTRWTARLVKIFDDRHSKLKVRFK